MAVDVVVVVMVVASSKLSIWLGDHDLKDRKFKSYKVLSRITFQCNCYLPVHLSNPANLSTSVHCLKRLRFSFKF